MNNSLNSLEGVVSSEIELNDDGSIHCYMPQINGKGFRCECGCNVFHKRVNEPNRYVCNSCKVEYIGE